MPLNNPRTVAHVLCLHLWIIQKINPAGFHIQEGSHAKDLNTILEGRLLDYSRSFHFIESTFGLPVSHTSLHRLNALLGNSIFINEFVQYGWRLEQRSLHGRTLWIFSGPKELPNQPLKELEDEFRGIPFREIVEYVDWVSNSLESFRSFTGFTVKPVKSTIGGAG